VGEIHIMKKSKLLVLSLLAVSTLGLTSCGSQGPNGEKGEPGIQGKQGEPGKDGKDGVNGKDGKDGVPGKDGKNGINGADGKTAWSNTILPSVGGYVVPSVGSAIEGADVTFTIHVENEYTLTAFTLNGTPYETVSDEDAKTLTCTAKLVRNGFVVFANFKKLSAEADKDTMVDPVTGEAYDTLDAAVTAGVGQVKLVKDSSVNSVNVRDGVNLKINLNNNNLAVKTNKGFEVNSGGTLEITGKGTFKEDSPYYAPILIKNTDPTKESNIIIDKDVTLEGWAGIFVDQNPVNNSKDYKVNIDVKGKINSVKDTSGAAGHGIYVNGQIVGESNLIKVHVASTAEIKSEGVGLYMAGVADVTIEDGATFTGVDSAVEIRAGKLTINGGTFTSTASTFKATKNGNGTTIEGAALAVVQHTTKLPIDVTVNKGTFKGQFALYGADVQENGDDAFNKVKITLNGGTFVTTSIVAGAKPIYKNETPEEDEFKSYPITGEGYQTIYASEVNTKTEEVVNDAGNNETIVVSEVKVNTEDSDVLHAAIKDALTKKETVDNKETETSKVEVTLPKGEFHIKDNNGTLGTVKDKSFSYIGSGKAEDTLLDQSKKTGSGNTEGGGMLDYKYDGAKSLEFKNMTLDFGTEAYSSFARVSNVKFEDCIIKGQQWISGGKYQFINCKFEQTGADTYCVNTYGAEDVKFVGCEFYSHSKSKAVFCYTEGAYTVTFTRSFDNCKFIFDGNDAEKSAIMINPTAYSNVNTYVIKVTNCQATGFKENGISNQTIVGLSSKEPVRDNITITIDGIQVYQYPVN
jgi:hypothetical protein